MSGRRAKSLRRGCRSFVDAWGREWLVRGDGWRLAPPSWARVLRRMHRRKAGVDYASSTTRRLVPPFEYASSTSPAQSVRYRVRAGRRMGPGILAAMLLAALSFPGAR